MKRYPILNGARLHHPDSPNVWLVFDGRRHRIQTPAVYNALFNETEKLIISDEIEEIDMGPELNDGTCLVRAEGTLPIYLVSGFPKVMRYFIPSYETFQNFGFDFARVRDVPSIILDTIPVGNVLISAAEQDLP